MIRKLLNTDIDRVADIWLKTNLKTHYFISNQYWKSNYELVKEMMSQSEVYVFEVDKMIQGFVGLNNEYIEGIFVSEEMQSCGIGKLLLDYIKDKKVRLQLNVYQKNARAISFYQREGFIIQCEGLDEATGEKEYTMLWKRKQKSEFVEETNMEDNKSMTVKKTVKSGITFGSALAMVISYTTWKSVGWAIFHGLLSWVYVIYFLLRY